jgi:hypothetical protein
VATKGHRAALRTGGLGPRTSYPCAQRIEPAELCTPRRAKAQGPRTRRAAELCTRRIATTNPQSPNQAAEPQSNEPRSEPAEPQTSGQEPRTSGPQSPRPQFF